MKKTQEQIHYNMQRVKSKDSEIEKILRNALWNKGYRYRKNVKDVFGHPDIVFKSKKVAIFCDSEFFHGKDWEILKPRLQKTKNSDYWVNKISRNRERDAEIDKQLLFEGWTVIRFWGKDIIKKTDECVRVVEETIFDLKIGDAEDQLCELSEENEWIQNK